MEHCYMCDKPKDSDEHVPPQCLFPESKDLPPGLDYRKNLITVPSCAEHNLRKSGDDEFLMFTLVANINVNPAGLNQWRTKIRRALQKRPTKKGIFQNLRGAIYRGVRTGVYDLDFPRLSQQLDHVSRGLYFFHLRQVWPHDIQLAIPFVFSSGSIKTAQYIKAMQDAASIASSFLSNEPRLGDNPQIFYYQYKLKSDSPGFVMKMVFYEGLEVVAISGGQIDHSSQAA